MKTDRTKQALRTDARQRRDSATDDDASAARELAQWAPQVRGLASTARPVISSYLAIGSELDPALLAAELAMQGATVALPVMLAKSAPLEFRAWSPGDPLVAREWGIREPAPECAVVEPDILLVPLLLVGRTGHRLGYGGGFYDRTLNQLRSRKPIIAIGIAYLSQMVDDVPQEAYDEALDYVLTPSGLEQFQPE